MSDELDAVVNSILEIALEEGHYSSQDESENMNQLSDSHELSMRLPTFSSLVGDILQETVKFNGYVKPAEVSRVEIDHDNELYSPNLSVLPSVLPNFSNNQTDQLNYMDRSRSATKAVNLSSMSSVSPMVKGLSESTTRLNEIIDSTLKILSKSEPEIVPNNSTSIEKIEQHISNVIEALENVDLVHNQLEKSLSLNDSIISNVSAIQAVKDLDNSVFSYRSNKSSVNTSVLKSSEEYPLQSNNPFTINVLPSSPTKPLDKEDFSITKEQLQAVSTSIMFVPNKNASMDTRNLPRPLLSSSAPSLVSVPSGRDTVRYVSAPLQPKSTKSSTKTVPPPEAASKSALEMQAGTAPQPFVDVPIWKPALNSSLRSSTQSFSVKKSSDYDQVGGNETPNRNESVFPPVSSLPFQPSMPISSFSVNPLSTAIPVFSPYSDIPTAFINPTDGASSSMSVNHGLSRRVPHSAQKEMNIRSPPSDPHTIDHSPDMRPKSLWTTQRYLKVPCCYSGKCISREHHFDCIHRHSSVEKQYPADSKKLRHKCTHADSHHCRGCVNSHKRSNSKEEKNLGKPTIIPESEDRFRRKSKQGRGFGRISSFSSSESESEEEKKIGKGHKETRNHEPTKSSEVLESLYRPSQRQMKPAEEAALELVRLKRMLAQSEAEKQNILLKGQIKELRWISSVQAAQLNNFVQALSPSAINSKSNA